MGKRAAVAATVSKAPKAARKLAESALSSECRKVVEAINAMKLDAGESEILNLVVRHCLNTLHTEPPHNYELQMIGEIDANLLREADSRQVVVTELEAQLVAAVAKAEEAKSKLEPQFSNVDKLKAEKEAMEKDYQHVEKAVDEACSIVDVAKMKVEQLAEERTALLGNKDEYGQVKKTFGHLKAGKVKAEDGDAEPTKLSLGEKNKSVKKVTAALATAEGSSPAMIAALKLSLVAAPDNRGEFGNAAVSHAEKVLEEHVAGLGAKLASFEGEAVKRDTAVSDAEARLAAEIESKTAKMAILNDKDNAWCEEESKAQQLKGTIDTQAWETDEMEKKLMVAKQHVSDYEAIIETFNAMKEQVTKPTPVATDEPVASGDDARDTVGEPQATP